MQLTSIDELFFKTRSRSLKLRWWFDRRLKVKLESTKLQGFKNLVRWAFLAAIVHHPLEDTENPIEREITISHKLAGMFES